VRSKPTRCSVKYHKWNIWCKHLNQMLRDNKAQPTPPMNRQQVDSFNQEEVGRQRVINSRRYGRKSFDSAVVIQ